jgi:DNA-binding response OmpR family regulator
MMSNTEQKLNGEDTNPTGRRIKVLFADDEEEMLDLLGIAAHTIGNFDYRLAKDGGEVEWYLRNESFDVLCLDVEMPIAYGTTIAAAVRRLDMSIPIIFLTGRCGREVRSTSHEVGAELVHKPADIGYLIELIKRLASERNPYHGPERRIMSINTTQHKRRATDQPFALPRTLHAVARTMKHGA